MGCTPPPGDLPRKNLEPATDTVTKRAPTNCAEEGLASAVAAQVQDVVQGMPATRRAFAHQLECRMFEGAGHDAYLSSMSPDVAGMVVAASRAASALSSSGRRHSFSGQ